MTDKPIIISLPSVESISLTEPETERPTCATCSAYVPNPKNGAFGNCHAEPPQALVVGMRQNMAGEAIPMIDSAFPPTVGVAWCRAYRAAKTNDNSSALISNSQGNA